MISAQLKKLLRNKEWKKFDETCLKFQVNSKGDKEEEPVVQQLEMYNEDDEEDEEDSAGYGSYGNYYNVSEVGGEDEEEEEEPEEKINFIKIEHRF